MTDGKHSSVEGGRSAAEAIFLGEGLPFPPLPDVLASRLQPSGATWFTTRAVAVGPYVLEHFVGELSEPLRVPDYAIVGFDGHGTNSWAVHCYIVVRRMALFLQLAWGGAYSDAKGERARIAATFAWASALQAAIGEAERMNRIPDGLRLEVFVSQFGRAGWRWVSDQPGAHKRPWNPAANMFDTVLDEVRLVQASTTPL